jgi:hypothetical protein
VALQELVSKRTLKVLSLVQLITMFCKADSRFNRDERP